MDNVLIDIKKNLSNVVKEEIESAFIALKKQKAEWYKKTYTFSLSSIKDSIPMWNYYSQQTGISIGFNVIKLIEFATNQNNKLRQEEKTPITFYQMAYNKEEVLSKIKEITNRMAKVYMNGYNEYDINGCYIDLITEIYRIKNSFFQYENEHRIILSYFDSMDENTKIETMIKNNTIKFYIDMEFKEDWNDVIDNIIISPFNNNDCIKENIYDFLIMNNININKDNIISSECPIR